MKMDNDLFHCLWCIELTEFADLAFHANDVDSFPILEESEFTFDWHTQDIAKGRNPEPKPNTNKTAIYYLWGMWEEDHVEECRKKHRVRLPCMPVRDLGLSPEAFRPSELEVTEQ